MDGIKIVQNNKLDKQFDRNFKVRLYSLSVQVYAESTECVCEYRDDAIKFKTIAIQEIFRFDAAEKTRFTN